MSDDVKIATVNKISGGDIEIKAIKQGSTTIKVYFNGVLKNSIYI